MLKDLMCILISVGGVPGNWVLGIAFIAQW
jgi:hypothetical protein